jgi:DNA repair protein SbcD/Mre11
MKIVHAADLHLDSPLRGLTQYEGAPVSEVRLATRRAFTALVDLCLEEDAKLLLIAGDLYDGDFRDYSTALCFTEQIGRLRQSDARVVWLRGNHDAANRITRHLRTADHVTELSCDTPASAVFEALNIAVHGQGYSTREVSENLAATYPLPKSDLINIGLLHTSLDGRPGHAPYAPCTAAELKAKGYDYWALGHVHAREVISEQPYIVFPGNLQGRHINETGPKGAMVLHVDTSRIHRVEARTLDCVRWELIEIDITRLSHWADVLDAATAAIEKCKDQTGDRVLALRVRLVGSSSAHGFLARFHSRIENELRAYCVDRGDIYLERVQVSTVGGLSAGALAQRKDALAELFREIDHLAQDTEAKKELWDSILRPLSAVSAELLRDEQIDPDEVIWEARGLLEAHLLTAGEGEP